MLTEEEKVKKAREIAHMVMLQIGNDEIMNRVVRTELLKNLLKNS